MPSPTAWPRRRSASRLADCSRVRSRALSKRPLKKLIERMPPSRIGCCKLICESMLVSSRLPLLRDHVPRLQLFISYELHEPVLRRQNDRRLALDQISCTRRNLHLRASTDPLDDQHAPVLTGSQR